MKSLTMKAAAAGALLAVAGAAQAQIVTFDEVTTSFQGTGAFSSGPLNFANPNFALGVWTSAPTEGDYNGTPYLLDGFFGTLSITADTPTFFLQSYDIAIGWYQPTSAVNMDVTYHLAAGGTMTGVLNLALNYQTISVGEWITKVEFDINDSPDGYISMDNIVVEVGVVPEPGTWAMLAAGLVAVGAAARRRSAS
jgi:hypothetical protein